MNVMERSNRGLEQMLYDTDQYLLLLKITMLLRGTNACFISQVLEVETDSF